MNRQSPQKILTVTDTWVPQINGVVRTLSMLKTHLEKLGHDLCYVTPDQFHTLPLPTYPEIKLAVLPGRKLKKIIHDFKPDAIHIATEGPLGFAARRFCLSNNYRFSTCFHTRLPEYLHARTRFPVKWAYGMERWFHKPASTTMVTTSALGRELTAKGFDNIRVWSRGVDTETFKIHDKSLLDHLPRPIWTTVGRVAVEKNLPAFLDLDLPGTKMVVGDGPALRGLKARYPEVIFTGIKRGEELAKHYAASDVFVFPSRTDTFGLVNLEALACGLPIAGYPGIGPIDILGQAQVGCLSEDLAEACHRALGIATPEECRNHALNYSWEASTRQFLENIVNITV